MTRKPRLWRRGFSCTAPVVLAFMLAACATEGGRTAPDIPVLRATVELTIGVAEGPDAYVFGRIGGVVSDPLGRVFAADIQANEVRVFDSAGEFLFTIGRRGAGPGEFDGPCCLAFGPRGRLWVRDGGNGRYNSYAVGEASAEYVGMRRMAHGAGGFAQALTFDPSGQLIDVGFVSGEIPPPVARFHLDSTSTVVETVVIPTPPADSIGEHVVERRASGRLVGVQYFQQPFGPRKLQAHSPRGGWAEAVSGHYAVLWHQPDTTFLVTGVARPPPPELTADERRAAEERLALRLQRTGITMRDLPFGVPARKTPLSFLHFDRLGSLWVEVSVAAGEHRRADVYNRSGELVHEVEWPAHVNLILGQMDSETALGISRDSIGVERIVGLRFRR